MSHKIIEVCPLTDYRLLSIFDNGVQKIYDVKPLFDWKDIFKQLKDLSLFDEVYVDKGGCGIVWNDQIDLGSEEIWNNGVEVNLDEDKIEALFIDHSLRQYDKNPKTYSHKEICQELFNEETLKAFQEADDIVSGKVESKKYKSSDELKEDILK